MKKFRKDNVTVFERPFGVRDLIDASKQNQKFVS
jgi:hypothetical protein